MFVFSREGAVIRGTGVRAAMRKYFVNFLLKVFHDEMILLLSVFVLRLGLEPAQLARVRRPEPVHVLGQPADVEHHLDE